MSNRLTEKYRPARFEDFYGNEDTIAKLRSVCRRKEGPPNSILLIGPRGCGKTTLARIIQKELEISDRDFREMNTGNVRGIDTIRDIEMESVYSPLAGKYKAYFFDECHKLTNDAQNALLKPLENPPDHVVFILATTDPQLLIPTILSRCGHFDVELLSGKEIRGLVEDILFEEDIKKFPPEAVKQIASVADGCPREAVVLLDIAIGVFKSEGVDALMEAIDNYSINQTTIKDLCQALLKKAPWKEIGKILKGIDGEPEQVRYGVLGYMNSVLMSNDNPQAAVCIENFSQSFMYSKKAGVTLACYYSLLGK
jgi:DNA polymerase III subunit gamma/tau